MSSTTRAAEIHVRDLEPADHDWARALIASHQGGTHRVARLGEVVDPLAMEGLVAEADGRPIGLASVHEAPGKGLEVVMLVAEPSGAGAGTALMETARQVATASGHGRLWLVTTNDNVGAIHFYLRRGMRVAMVHAGAVEADRALKPEIPAVNPVSGVPVRDLVELELAGDELAQPLSTIAFPRAEDLDSLPAEAFVAEIAPLFEGGGRFVERLAEIRPIQNEDGLLVAAFEVAHGLPEKEQIELVEQHPRIGGDAAEMSEHSSVEQGYTQDPDLTAEEFAEERAVAEREATRVHEELAMLNELYEQRFGFRYVVFVAGRPRSEIVPLIERALRNDRDAELRRAVDETIYIAGDRLRRLRGLGTEV
jgi:2-oxo-4-hydroxy-4-carboxy--5-ureidoimidazoline (OHCU) decarboxylase/GNAT superfamily N-acetyltransferase